MPASLTTLTTRAQCDEALASLAAEVRTYQHRNTNLAFADETATLNQADTATQLAGATASVTFFTDSLARPNLPTAEKKRLESQLLTARYRFDRLTAQSGTQTGSAAYLADVDADQVAAQVAVLTAAQAAVTAHRATLPA